MQKVAIIGSGFIGRAWAISFARAGYAVSLWDETFNAAEEALRYIDMILPDLASGELLRGADVKDIRSRMRIASSLEDAVVDAIHIQENTPENVEVKQKTFALLDKAANSDTIIASSTSAILPSQFTAELAGRARCVVVHPLNPPYLIPAVEIVPAPWTDVGVVNKTADLLRTMGHSPIVMKRELDGFVMNRLQGALLEEAFRLVAEGYACVEDIDVGLREGLALRWSFMGPFETIDLNAPGGVRDYVERYEQVYKQITASALPHPQWNGPVLNTIESERRKVLSADQLKSRQAWRDRRLISLAAYKQRAAKNISG
jgi:L-gulonate 3-dehydrogenase